MSKYVKGDYTKCYEDICEIWYEDNLYCIVRLEDADKIIRVLNENEQLKQALKESYINEICENCKYGHYWISETFGFGKEGEFECTKKHFGNEHWKCDGLTECNDFELNLKGDVIMTEKPLGANPLDYHIIFTPPPITFDNETEQEKWLKKRIIETLDDCPKKKIGYLVMDMKDKGDVE